jgi:hypothetical protein
MKNNIHLGLNVTKFLLEWELFQTEVIMEIKSQFYVQLFFFRKLCPLWDNVEKYCNADQATDENMEYARWKMDI